MEAKDTVVKTNVDNCNNTLGERLLEQAEITWKARDGEVKVAAVRGFEIGKEQGKAEGRKEVAEWGNKPCPHVLTQIMDGSETKKRECDVCWQAFLKGKGIDA